MKINKNLVALLVIIVLSFCLYAKETEFLSIPLSSKIKIDGNLEDWKQIETTIWNDGISASFQNDGYYLYGLIIVRDQRIKQRMLSIGMTLWFNTKGKTKKEIGIKYPIGSISNQNKQKQSNTEKNKKNANEEIISKMVENLEKDIELIFDQKKGLQKMKISEISGMEISIKESEGLLIYEIKVPCIEKSPFLFSVYPQKNNLIGVGLEIGSNSSSEYSSLSEKRGMKSGKGKKKGGRSSEGTNRQEKIELWGIINTHLMKIKK